MILQPLLIQNTRCFANYINIFIFYITVQELKQMFENRQHVVFIERHHMRIIRTHVVLIIIRQALCRTLYSISCHSVKTACLPCFRNLLIFKLDPALAGFPLCVQYILYICVLYKYLAHRGMLLRRLTLLQLKRLQHFK